MIDTSVWVGHFRQRNEHLVALLEGDRVVRHPCVVMEVACGTPPNRRTIVSMLAELESAPLATADELLELMERRSLYGRGCGLVDISLLAATLLSEKTLLWTADQRLQTLATAFNRSYRPALHF